MMDFLGSDVLSNRDITGESAMAGVGGTPEVKLLVVMAGKMMKQACYVGVLRRDWIIGTGTINAIFNKRSRTSGCMFSA